MTPIGGLIGSLYKIKTGLQNGNPVAVIAQSAPGNHGSIVELGTVVGVIQPIGSVSAGVAAPQGIAVSNAVQAAAINCQQGNGCNLLGDSSHSKNVLTHLVGGSI